VKFLQPLATLRAFCFCMSSAQAGTYAFTTIADPNATGRSDPMDINNLGQIVGAFGEDFSSSVHSSPTCPVAFLSCQRHCSAKLGTPSPEGFV
jgi:hypothetical protein